MKKAITVILALILSLSLAACLSRCDYPVSGTGKDTARTRQAANTLQGNQPTPEDISYSLERYNLIRRAYWVNGQREKADSLVCEIEKPLGYIVLFSGNTVVGSFVVDGKVSSLNSFLTPDSEYYEYGSVRNDWLADIDGTYGENDSGVFFFTPDGKYIEWTGEYLYSDIPFEVSDPVVSYEVAR